MTVTQPPYNCPTSSLGALLWTPVGRDICASALFFDAKGAVARCSDTISRNGEAKLSLSVVDTAEQEHPRAKSPADSHRNSFAEQKI
jgi:hypothetical protein